MLTSGLALAGANATLRGLSPLPDAEDGILPAEDAAVMDLTATELVVLSACETGPNHIHRGEGVFARRRALMLAGARTLILSLWKVPDLETRELMIELYRRPLVGEPRAEALREVHLSMKARDHDPFYWGMFICQGDPGPPRAPARVLSSTGVET